MKKFTHFAAAVLLVASVASCKKEETTPTPTPTPNPTPSTPSAVSPTPSGGDISGALISIKMDYTYTVTGAPMPVSLESEIGSAVFYSAPGSTTMVDAGAVSVNTIALDKATNNAYSKMGTTGLTPSTLNFDNGSNWSVAGAGSVTGFTYNHSTSFPKFTGTAPSSVTKANGLTISLSGKISGSPDSIYVLVAAGNVSVLKAFAGNASSATISASDLSGLPNVTDNTALLEVCPFKYNTTNVGGKKYVAIKEYAMVQNININ